MGLRDRDCALLCRAKGALPMNDALRAFFSRLRAIFSKTRLDDDFNEELAAHVDLLTSENEKAGMTPEEARRVALVRVGGRELTRERVICDLVYVGTLRFPE